MKVRYAVPHFLMPRRVARVVALALFALCQGGTVEPGLARSSVAPAPQHHRSGAHRLTVDPSCFGSFSSCEISPGQQLQTTFGPASGACAMHTVAVDTSPWVHVSFNPVNLQSGQSSVVTISAGIPNIANGQGGGGQAGYTCGSLSPPVPVSIDFDPMPEPPCPPCASAPGNAAPPQPYVGGPVNVATGQDHYAATDVAFEGPFGIAFTRTYDSLLIGTQTVNSTTYGPSSLGSAGWQTNYDAYLYNDSGNNRFVLHDESGQFHYLASPAAGASAYSSVSGMTLSSNSAQTQYTVTAWTGQKWTFNSLGAMISKTDRTGNVQTITRDTTSGNNDRILNVADPLGRKLCYFYDSTNRITAVVWEPSGTCPTSVPSSGTIVKLAYDSGTNCTTGQLCSVTEPDGAKWTYQYNNADATFPNGLIAVVNPRGDYEEQTTYAAGQVATQMTGNCSTYPCADTGGMLSFTYPNNGASQTVVTDGLGRTTTYSYDLTTYELLGVSGFLCGCGGDQTRTYTYDGYERLTSVADDGNGNGAHTITLNYGRDANGNAYPGPTSVVENVDNSGTQRTTSYTYYPIGDPRQDLAETTTLPSVDLGGTSTMSVNDTFATNGLLTQRTKTGYINGTSTSYTWKWSFDSRGRLLQATGPRSTSPAEVTKDVYYPDTDANTSLAGQLDTETDALGHVKHYATLSGFTAYTPFGSPESVTDVNGVPTGMTYDARGRLLTSTLNVGGTSPLVTTWAYDTVGRVTKKVLPAGNGFTTTYDTSERQKAASNWTLRASNTNSWLRPIMRTIRSFRKPRSSVRRPPPHAPPGRRSGRRVTSTRRRPATFRRSSTRSEPRRR